jgi:hypothetical protein
MISRRWTQTMRPRVAQSPATDPRRRGYSRSLLSLVVSGPVSDALGIDVRSEDGGARQAKPPGRIEEAPRTDPRDLDPSPDLGWLGVRIGMTEDTAGQFDGRPRGVGAASVDIPPADTGSSSGIVPAALSANDDAGNHANIFVRPAAPKHANQPNAGTASQHMFAEPVDGGGGVDMSPMEYTDPGPTMRASDDLWWFNGAAPEDYPATVQLTAAPTNGTYYTNWRWTITAGSAMVDFLGHPGQDVVEQQVGGTSDTIGIVSTAASGSLDDVTIETQGFNPYLGVWSGVIATVSLAVPRPYRLVHLKDVDRADATYGYVSEIHYRIENQFNRTLPRRIEINEKWTGVTVVDFKGTNWTRPTMEGSVKVDPADWPDYVSGVGMTGGPMPVPLAPGTPLGNTKVIHWPGEWYVGSLTIGEGVKVQTNTWERYQDHARHESVTSPP